MQRQETRIARNLLALQKIRISDIMTPRTVVLSLNQELTVGETFRKYHPLRFARIPVFQENKEDVTGYVTRFSIHDAHSASRDETPLKDLSRSITILPELASVADALEAFVRDKQHIALVVDEYGGKAGIVTLEDVLETLLGDEIVDETDPAEDMRELARLRRRQGQSAF
jgi:CBS domain containing-hemolysin-like protein